MFVPGMFQVCMNRLGKFEEAEYKSAVALYARYLLMAAQWQLDTVNHVSQPDKQYENMIPVKHETLEPGFTVQVFQPNLVEDEGEDVEDDIEGGGDGEEYEDEEDNLDSEERYEEVTTKKPQMKSISTEPSKIDKDDIFIDNHIKPLIITDKAITFTTTTSTTVKHIPQPSESAVTFEVTEQFNVNNKGLSSESPLNKNNNSFIEGNGNTDHHEKKTTTITKDVTIKNNHSELDSKVDDKINLESDFHENKIYKTENSTSEINNTATKTTASPNFIPTSSLSHTNQANGSLMVNEIKDTTITKLILNSTPSYVKKTNSSQSTNKTEDTAISNISNNEAGRDNKTTTTVSPLNSLNGSSNSTTHGSGSTVVSVPDRTNDSTPGPTDSPKMSNEMESDNKENKTLDTISNENETIDKKSALNYSVPAEAPVHLPKSVESNFINAGESDDEYIDGEEVEYDDLEDAGSSNLVVDPDSSTANTNRRKRSNEYYKFSNEVIMISKLVFDYGTLLNEATVD